MTPITKDKLIESFIQFMHPDQHLNFLRNMKAISPDDEIKEICGKMIQDMVEPFDDGKEYKGMFV